MLYFDRIDVSEGIDVNEQVHPKCVIFSLLVFLKL